ncbi:hypothetical protein CIC12_11580, partial [Burkholderia sp. SG-MS1]|uniref:autotransporter-associated beta strand repeat-containing protein n=1 Tax=Paraburkholderia sp. SG-MS1 TaxID=2023741 RepID=UPI001581112F
PTIASNVTIVGNNNTLSGGGMGGAVFVQAGGNLTLAGPLTINGNSVTAGTSASANGSAFGSGLFLQGDGTVTFAPGAGESQTVSDVITDQTGSGGTGANAGSYALLKTGAGTTTLSAANTYSGGTLVTGGLINFSAAGNFGSGQITLNGGGLQWATGTATDISSRLAALGADGGTLDTNGNNVTLANAISGTGGLTKAGAGTLTLSGSNTYSGATAVDVGTLQAGAATNRFSPGSAFTIAAGAFLDLNNFSQTIGSLAGAGNVTLGTATLTAGGDNTSTTYSGVLSGTGGLSKTGSGSLTLSGSNTYTGLTTISAGTLQIGDGGTTGSIVGDVTDNGMLAFDRSDAWTLGGVISGTGTVTQTGSGTTILTGTNTYTGGTTIVAGTLQIGNGGTTGSIVGDVTDNGTLTFDRSDASTFGGVISGTGPVTQAGSGTTILTGTNTYTGGTTIAAGTLQIGNGGTTGSIVGDVTDNGTLTFDRSDAFTQAGVISGTGAVTQSGAGTTTLSGANTYTGGTTISAGTLSGSATSFGSGPVLDNAALVINEPGSASFANVISGTGSFTSSGTGTLTMTGTGSSVGTTTVAAGTLTFAQSGAFTSSSYSTQSGATTAIGGTSQLAVSGAFTQSSGSTLDVTLGANNPVITAGSATLDGTLNVAGVAADAPSSASALPATEFTLIHTTGGITGDFSSVSLGGATSPVDYLTLAATRSAGNLDYNAGFGLTWQAGVTNGNGTFTLT